MALILCRKTKTHVNIVNRIPRHHHYYEGGSVESYSGNRVHLATANPAGLVHPFVSSGSHSARLRPLVTMLKLL